MGAICGKGEKTVRTVETVQVVLIVLKLLGVVTWSWWGVFFPLLAVISLSILLALRNVLERWMDNE